MSQIRGFSRKKGRAEVSFPLATGECFNFNLPLHYFVCFAKRVFHIIHLWTALREKVR